MLATSLKVKVERVLKKGGFSKSKKAKSRVKGFYNITSGFTFGKFWDEYFLYWTNGNMVHRGMPNEEIDKETEKLYQYLVESGMEAYLEWDTLKRQKMIKLKHSS